MTRKNKPIKVRNTVARAAFERGGAGKHDNRPKRQRTRQAALRAAMAD